MPLCPQITNTAVTVTSTGMTTTSVTPVVNATTSDTASLSTSITTAQNTANGKNSVTYSTSAPSGSGTRVGDIWWQYSAGIVIGQYSWDGSAWVSSPISSAVIANLDAAKITSGIISSIEYNNGSGTFRVTAAGALTASSATITGTINATAGYIGSAANGWNLSSSGYLTNSGGTTILYPTTTPGGNSTTYSIYTDRGVLAERLYASGSQATAIYSSGGVYAVGGISAGVTAFNVNTSGAITAVASITSTGAITTTSSITSDGAATFANSGGTSTSFQVLSSGLLRSAFTYARQVSTSTRAVLQDSTGNFGNSTSTRRNKHQIESYQIDLEALLKLDVKTFKYNLDLDSEQTTQYGFIAEEAQELGLNELIQLDSDGIPDYFAYEKLPVFLLSLVQDLSKRVAELEKK